MSGRQIRASENLSNAALLARVQNLETLLGVGEVQEPGAATLTPSSMTDWSMAPGTNITFYDTAGIARVVLGDLPSGDYGLQITDPNSVANEVWPVSSAYYGGSLLTTTSLTPVTIADSPEVTCWIGASGDCLITVNAFISFTIDTSDLFSDGGNVFVTIDGGSATQTLVLAQFANGWTGGMSLESSANVAMTRRLSEWTGTVTPNADHTFALKFSGIGGNTISFGALGIIIQPL